MESRAGTIPRLGGLEAAMTFARWVFWIAGASGVLMILPLYAEARFFEGDPPAINRPEFYYAFVGVCRTPGCSTCPDPGGSSRRRCRRGTPWARRG